MRLKKHNAAAAFHSQLSAILEKLMVLAVEEIKELVFDFCEEISREKAQDTDLCERTGQPQDQEERLFDTSDSFYIEPQDASSEPYEHLTQTSSREDLKKKHISEQNYMKSPVTNDFAISAQEALSPNCKFEQAAATCKNPATITQEEDCQDGSKQSSFEPPEDSKDHLNNYNSPDETQSTPYEDFSSNQDLGRDVEFHVKQEEETSAFETGNYTGLQMQTGHMETGVQPVGQETLLINRASCSTSCRVAPVPLGIPGPMYTNFYLEQRPNLNKGNTRALPRPNKVLFKCEYCDKMYPFPSLLKAHNLKHTEGKQLVCGVCGKFFKWEYSLRRHEKMHLFELKS